jgi:hypothetical protein
MPESTRLDWMIKQNKNRDREPQDCQCIRKIVLKKDVVFNDNPRMQGE